jgi:transposase InsO family protein
MYNVRDQLRAWQNDYYRRWPHGWLGRLTPE